MSGLLGSALGSGISMPASYTPFAFTSIYPWASAASDRPSPSLSRKTVPTHCPPSEASWQYGVAVTLAFTCLQPRVALQESTLHTSPSSHDKPQLWHLATEGGTMVPEPWPLFRVAFTGLLKLT